MAQEVATTSMWDKICCLKIEDGVAAQLASILAGEPANFRSTDVYAKGPPGHAVRFESCSERQQGFADLKRFADAALCPVTEAVMTHVRLVILHPFNDGNGRFARSLFHGPLGRAGIIDKPRLGLGAILNLRRETMAALTIAASVNCDWPAYVNAVVHIIEEGIDHINI